MTTSWHIKGKAEGIAEGKAEAVLQLGTVRFGAPSRKVLEALERMRDVERLDALLTRILVATSWQDLLSR